MTGRMSTTILALVLAGLVSAACGTPATKEECKQMCENLTTLRGKIDTSTEKQLIAKVEERFANEKKRLEEWKARDLKEWDDELAEKLAELEDEEEKQTLKEEYEKKKAATVAQHDPGIAKLVPDKKKALEEAKKDYVANMAAWKEEIDNCVAQAEKEGISQKLAQCRIKATSTDQYWNLCH